MNKRRTGLAFGRELALVVATSAASAAIVTRLGRMRRTGNDNLVRRLQGSDRQRAEEVEEALRESEERLRLACASAQAGTWDWDIEKNQLLWSEDTYRMHGLDPSTHPQMSYERWLRSVHPEDRARADERAQQVLAQGQSDYQSELRIIHPMGGLRWILARGRVHYDIHGQPVRMLGIALDITERRRAEEMARAAQAQAERSLAQLHEAHAERAQLLERERAARAEAEKASRLKDEFLATLSHELQTPLTSILGWAQILRQSKDPCETPAKVVRGLEAIERGARLQKQIVTDLLDMSRIVRGLLRLRIEPVDLKALIDSALDAVRPAAEAKGIEIKEIIEPLGEPVRGDAARLLQVVWNLLMNAVKFTQRGGHVEVRAAPTEEGVVISVSDTGPGLAPELMPHLFERFWQADGSSTRRYGGLGLGLALVRHLVELHGGTVRAESAGSGRGATFTVELPRRPVASTPGDGKESSIEERGRTWDVSKGKRC
jgi:PAS domain S-box-containing protein